MSEIRRQSKARSTHMAFTDVSRIVTSVSLKKHSVSCYFPRSSVAVLILGLNTNVPFPSGKLLFVLSHLAPGWCFLKFLGRVRSSPRPPTLDLLLYPLGHICIMYLPRCRAGLANYSAKGCIVSTLDFAVHMVSVAIIQLVLGCNQSQAIWKWMTVAVLQ